MHRSTAQLRLEWKPVAFAFDLFDARAHGNHQCSVTRPSVGTHQESVAASLGPTKGHGDIRVQPWSELHWHQSLNRWKAWLRYFGSIEDWLYYCQGHVLSMHFTGASCVTHYLLTHVWSVWTHLHWRRPQTDVIIFLWTQFLRWQHIMHKEASSSEPLWTCTVCVLYRCTGVHCTGHKLLTSNIDYSGQLLSAPRTVNIRTREQRITNNNIL